MTRSFDRTKLRALLRQVIGSVTKEFDLPWIVKRLGTRSEYWSPPKNGGEAHAAVDPELDR